MSLEKKIMEDLKMAMKEKNQAAMRSIRAIKSAILLLKTDGKHKEITSSDELKMLQKLVKQRKESLEIYEKQSRDDLAIKEREEIEIISKYLPAQLNPEELKKKKKKMKGQSLFLLYLSMKIITFYKNKNLQHKKEKSNGFRIKNETRKNPSCGRQSSTLRFSG